MDLIIINKGIFDLSFNEFFKINNNSNEINLNYFGGIIYANRLYFNFLKNLCSIKLDKSDFRIDIDDIDLGTHYIQIHNNYIYVQETYLNRIKRFTISNDGIIDQNSLFICPIYKLSINPNLINSDLQLTYFKNKINFNQNYRHINSMCFIDILPNILICSSSFLRNGPIINNNPTNIKVNSKIDFINIIDWKFDSYEVPVYAIHDIQYFNNYIYFVGDNSIHKFDPINKEYLGPVFTFDLLENTNNIARGLFFKNDLAYFYLHPIISRNNNSNILNNTSISKNITKQIIVNSNNWLLVNVLDLENTTVYSYVKNYNL
jgi:hypothetical protein